MMGRARALFLLVWAALVLTTGAASAKRIDMQPLLPLAQKLYALWNEDEKKGAWEKLRIRLRGPPQLEGLLIALDFLKMRIFDQRANHPVYFIAHAQLLWLTDDKSVRETAAISAGVAQLLLETDAARCGEEGAGQALIAQTQKELAGPLAYLVHMPLAARKVAAKQILDREALVAHRPPNLWLCADAPQAQEAIKAWVVETKQKSETLSDTTAPGGEIVLYPPPPASLIPLADQAAADEKRLATRRAFARLFGLAEADPPAPLAP